MSGNASQSENPTRDLVQEAVDRVPPTLKLSQPDAQPNSSDPRKRADFTFMDRMRSEKERRSTFFDYSERAWVGSSELAAAGFFFTGSVDRCQCAFCRGILRNWEPNDDPMTEHKRYFGDCPFVNGKSVGNIPLSNSVTTVSAKLSYLLITANLPLHYLLA